MKFAHLNHIFIAQGRATSSLGCGCCCCCLGALLGNALSPPTAKLGKIMNLCSSGATASTTSLSSTGQAERSGGGGVPGGGGISNGGGGGGGVTGSGGGGGNTSDGLSEATHCFGGSGGGVTASGPEEPISPANGRGASGAQQPSGSNGHGQLHNENNAIMPPETRPKMVTVKHPESNKPKPTTKKSKPIQADQDVIKALQRCRDEGKGS